MKDLVKTCNGIFMDFWENNREQIQQRGPLILTLNLLLGELEKKNKQKEFVCFYLYLYPEESQKYKVTFNDTLKQGLAVIEETDILSPHYDAFENYKEYAPIVGAYAEAIRGISLKELIVHQEIQAPAENKKI